MIVDSYLRIIIEKSGRREITTTMIRDAKIARLKTEGNSQPLLEEEIMNEDDKQKIAHDSLLREMHNIDDITEKHSQIVLAISAALIVFASTNLYCKKAIQLISFFGISIGIIWILKTIRHRMIFRECHEKLSILGCVLRINAIRTAPKKPYKHVFSFDGFTLLLWYAAFLIIFWIFILFNYGF